MVCFWSASLHSSHENGSLHPVWSGLGWWKHCSTPAELCFFKSLTGERSSCLLVRWAWMNDESVCLIGWEMKQHGKNEATYLLRWFNGGGVSSANSLWEHSSCFSWYYWPFLRPLCPPLLPLQLCLFWMACLIIYHKGKGSSWSNKHATALNFIFHQEGHIL